MSLLPPLGYIFIYWELAREDSGGQSRVVTSDTTGHFPVYKLDLHPSYKTFKLWGDFITVFVQDDL